ncbi:hypothetical protein [Dactylosporangium sp. NPDC049140]|uniref:hypothetical protein n=1 Tax=Dactylosporangium sp. NPDC049140 TaxID=3155647 RepID=UPI0033C36EC7
MQENWLVILAEAAAVGIFAYAVGAVGLMRLPTASQRVWGALGGVAAECELRRQTSVPSVPGIDTPEVAR